MATIDMRGGARTPTRLVVLPPEQVFRLHEKYLAKVPYSALEATYGCSRKTIRRILKESGKSLTRKRGRG